MTKLSAGILLFRRAGSGIQVLLVHPGGPFWAEKDSGAWSIPKGEYSEGEDPLGAAKREFEEELGVALVGSMVELGSVKQRGGKVVAAWAVEGDFDPSRLRSNTFTLEWPPRSGRQQEFPEVDRAEWFGVEEARTRLRDAQIPLLDRLLELAHGSAR